jgi:transcriptional regulator with XRE-family HTH domain
MSGKKWKDLRDRHLKTDEARAAYERAREELEQEMADYSLGLADLRRARKMTQQQVSRSMGVSQAQVSRVENQADFYLSTLRSFVEAMGGELRLMVVFPDMTEAIEVDLPEITGIDSEDPARDVQERPEQKRHLALDEDFIPVGSELWKRRTAILDQIQHIAAQQLSEFHGREVKRAAVFLGRPSQTSKDDFDKGLE